MGTSLRDTLISLVNKRMREYEALTASLPVAVVRRNHQPVFHIEMQVRRRGCGVYWAVHLVQRGECC